MAKDFVNWDEKIRHIGELCAIYNTKKMTAENVIFQIEGVNYPKVFPKQNLGLGRTLYVKIIDNDIEIKETAFKDADKYAISWIAPSNWSITLIKGYNLEGQFVDSIAHILDGYISEVVVEEKLRFLSSQLRPEHLFKTKELENSKLNNISAVFERLNLIQILKKDELNKELFSHWEPLCVYHLLTCFDLLGQPCPWLTFDAWLKSDIFTKHQGEHEAKLTNKSDIINSSIELYQRYNAEYGVRNSFYKFINEIIPPSAKNKLVSSVKFIINKNPPASGTTTEHSNEEEVMKYLFLYRNNYTHKAKIIHGVGDFYLPKEIPMKLTWRMQPRQEFKAEEWISIMTLGWPDIIETTVKIGLAEYINRIT